MTKLEDYASEPGKSAMDLVLFRYDDIISWWARLSDRHPPHALSYRGIKTPWVVTFG